MKCNVVFAVVTSLVLYEIASSRKIAPSLMRIHQGWIEHGDPDIDDDDVLGPIDRTQDSYEYGDPEIDERDPCSARNHLELTEIKNELMSLKSLVESIHQKLDPDFKPKAKEESKGVLICPEGFTYLSDVHSCYKAIEKRHKWSSAAEQCQKLNASAHLISIDSPEESEAVTKYLKKEFKSTSASGRCHRPLLPYGTSTFWTGGQRVNTSDCSSEFVWKTDAGNPSPLNYTNWADGEPNCHNGDEKCAELMLGRVTAWNDVMCYVRCCPLCEFDLK